MTGKRGDCDVGRADASRDARIRVSKLSQNNFKTNKHAKGRKQSQSPCLGSSGRYRKDFETPKRRARSRFNLGSNGDSPSEAEAPQDIIWDPASPPPIWNGKGPGGSAVEISDIVDRIAPDDKKPVESDSVLQWIGDNVVSCTPEVQRPRFRRISARRQSNNVEDLMKLAKQFDINMTRQDKERNMERLQESEARTIEDLNHLNKSTTGLPKPEGLSHEEELHALFDGPTQHVSGRLSPPSFSCTPESRTESVVLGEQRSGSEDSKNFPDQPPKPDFDDDWENDDLLNDSFVLELTQNPELLSAAAEKKPGQRGPDALRKYNHGSAGDSSKKLPETHSGISSYTKISTKLHCNDTSTLTKAQHLPKASPDLTKMAKSRCQVQEPKSVCYRQEANSGWKKNVVTGSESPKVEDSKTSGQASGSNLKDSEPQWDDGDDDDLLYQACDDVERISASQEQQKDDSSNLASNVPTNSPSKTSLFTNSASFPSKQAVHPGQSGDTRQPVRVFARSYSIPGASGALAKNQDKTIRDSQMNQNPYSVQRGQYRFTQVKLASGGCSISQKSTFKRHQSDPVALGNKVFVAAQPQVKCSDAEIERKKQEAIARRRLRLQASQKAKAAT